MFHFVQAGKKVSIYINDQSNIKINLTFQIQKNFEVITIDNCLLIFTNINILDKINIFETLER